MPLGQLRVDVGIGAQFATRKSLQLQLAQGRNVVAPFVHCGFGNAERTSKGHL